MFVESIDIKRGNLMLHSYLGPNCYSPIRASSVSPLDWVGAVSEISPYLWILSVKFSLCSSERAGWLGFPDLGVSTLISVSCGLKIFAIWTLQPGYRDESEMNCSNEFCINCSDTGGGHLGIFWVGMCRPGLETGTPFLKKFPLKLIPRSRNGPIFYTPF